MAKNYAVITLVLDLDSPDARPYIDKLRSQAHHPQRQNMLLSFRVQTHMAGQQTEPPQG